MEAVLKRIQKKMLRQHKESDEDKEPRSVLSPDQEMYRECLSAMFEDGLNKLKISLILPKILANPLTLHQYLKDTEYAGTYATVKQYFMHLSKIKEESKRNEKKILTKKLGGRAKSPAEKSPRLAQAKGKPAVGPSGFGKILTTSKKTKPAPNKREISEAEPQEKGEATKEKTLGDMVKSLVQEAREIKKIKIVKPKQYIVGFAAVSNSGEVPKQERELIDAAVNPENQAPKTSTDKPKPRIFKAELTDTERNIDLITLRLIDYFQHNIAILKYLPPWLEDLDDYDKTILNAFELLGKIAHIHLSHTAKYTMELEKILFNLHQKNEESKTSSEGINSRLDSNKSHLRWITSARDAMRSQIINSLEEKRQSANIFVNETVKNNVRRMKEIDDELSRKREETNLQREMVNMNYKKEMKMNEDKVINIRNERTKLLIQFENLREKYDSTMLAKYKVLMELKQKHAEESVICAEIHERYYNAKCRHEDIVVAYKEKKIRNFREKRAVRIIEKWICELWAYRWQKAHEEAQYLKQLMKEEKMNKKLGIGKKGRKSNRDSELELETEAEHEPDMADVELNDSDVVGHE